MTFVFEEILNFYSNLSNLANLGTFIYGLSTLLLVVIGFYEFKMWKAKRIIELRSEVAAELIIATKNLAGMLLTLSNRAVGARPFERADENVTPIATEKDSNLENEFNRRIRQMEQELSEFKKARIRAETYLDDNINNLTNEFWKIFIKICDGFQFMIIVPRICEERIKADNDVYGKETKNEITKISNDLIEQLKPIARMMKS